MVDLFAVAHTLVANGKGILAADESNKSADARLVSYGIAPGEEMRRKNRELFLAAPGIEEYLSGVILYEETLAQKTDDGTLFPALLAAKGIIPGIKVDQGLEPFPESKDEVITNGLLGLPERLEGYASASHTGHPGFTKWRAEIRIDGTRLPSNQAIHENMKRLASYALEAQRAGMVPIVEPEVMMTGNHSRLRAREVLASVLSTLMHALEDQAVDLTGVILKTSMAVSGKESGREDTPEEVAEDTVGVLLENIPAIIPGIVFLSGGQGPDQSIANLAAIVARAKGMNAPWPLTYSFSRAFQHDALTLWQGKDENVPAAREAYMRRLAEAAAAVRG